MKKKGFALMEIVIVMALVSLMVGAVGSMLISYVKSYKNSVVQNKGFNYLNDAIVIIDKEVNKKAGVVKAEGNIIEIDYADGTAINHIKCKNGELYILYTTMNKSVIIDDVKDFVAIKSGGNIYIKVVWYNGQSIERCLAIENAN